MNNKQIFGIITATILMLPLIGIGLEQIYAVRYQDHDGKILTQKQYDTRHAYCWSLKFDKTIPMDTDCKSWIVTYDGEYQIAKKIFEESDLFN